MKLGFVRLGAMSVSMAKNRIEASLGCEAQTLPITGLVSQLYSAGLREHGEKDLSAVSEAGCRPA